MVLHNPNNWHWTDRAAGPSAKKFLTEKLVGIEAKQDAISVEISRLLSMDGDVDVAQRKGLVLAIYDVRLQLEWTGKVPIKEKNEDEEEIEASKDVSGTITIPEVDQDMDKGDFVFEIDIYSASSEKEPAKELVRREILPQLREHLVGLREALIQEHGKDIQHAPGVDPSSGFRPTPTMPNAGAAKSGAAKTSAASTSSGGKVNVTSFEDDQQFVMEAERLYDIFTDQELIARHFRTSPKFTEKSGQSAGKTAQVGTSFEMFGSVSGEFVRLERPQGGEKEGHIEQKWRFAEWPEKHFSLLKLTLRQDNANGVTNMHVVWEGVPVGHDESTKRQWMEKYVVSLKPDRVFGAIS